MKTLLLQPPESLEKLMGKGAHFVPAVPPMGLMYIGTNLKTHGFESEILDANFMKWTVEETAEAIGAKNPDLLGISCLTANASNVFYVCKGLREKGFKGKIILGNVHASAFSEFFLIKGGVDFIGHGEGEDLMVELLAALQDKKIDFSHIAGLSWKEGETVKHNPPRPFIKDLDKLAIPDRDQVNFPEYRDLPNRRMEKREVDMIFSSRGCVFKCTFCCVNGEKYRRRSAENTVDEIEYLIDNYDIHEFAFGDPLFIANKKRAIAICKEIIRRNLDVKWFCEGHAHMVDKELLQHLKRAGCTAIAYGIESGVQHIQDGLNKGTNLEEVKEAVKLTKEVGIECHGLFILGCPGETKEDTLNTIEFALNLPVDRAQFSIMTPYPGTPLYDKLVENGEIILKDWDDPGFVEDWFAYSAYISYTDLKPIWVTGELDYQWLKDTQKSAIRRFYMRPHQLLNEFKGLKLTNLPFLFRYAKSVVASLF